MEPDEFTIPKIVGLNEADHIFMNNGKKMTFIALATVFVVGEEFEHRNLTV